MRKTFWMDQVYFTMYAIHTLRHMLESHAVVVTSIDWWWIFQRRQNEECNAPKWMGVTVRVTNYWTNSFFYLNLFFLKKEHFRAWRECCFDKVNKFSTKITKLFSIYTFYIQTITEITPISIQGNVWNEKVFWKNVWILKFKIST